MTLDALSIPASVRFGDTRLLLKKVSVIQLVPTGLGERARLGLMTDLPRGAEVCICGDGFNPRTVKISCDGLFYFAFRDDLVSTTAEPVSTTI